MRDIMKLEKTYEISLFIITCILTSYIGRIVSGILVLPVWLDSVGTVLAAYVYGPVCGAVTGAAANILYSMHYKAALFYGLVNIAVGIATGICARKGFLKNIFGMMSVAFLAAVISVMISAPLNYIIADGSTRNIWGDGVAGLLTEMGLNKTYSYIVGEFYLDFLDKSVSMLLLFFIVKLYNRRKGIADKKRKNKKALLGIFLFMLVSGATAQAEENTGSTYDFRKYIQTVYNGEDGLAGGMASDIAQTKDGVLWIGTYGGLYRYSGNNFQWMNHLESVKTVNCLYTDEAGRLWIGTDDNGLSICIKQDISNVLNKENGLPSNSVRCITENTEGYYYVGTADSLVVITLSGGIGVYGTIPGITCADSLSADQKGNVAAVTAEGNLYIAKGKKIIAEQALQEDGEVYSCCAFDRTGKLYAGTSGNKILVYKLSSGKLKKISSIQCGRLKGINSLYFTEEDALFACADNGTGYSGNNKTFHSVDTGSFNSSIGHMLSDYQGNLWYTSSKSGLLRLCPSVFTEIYKEEELYGNTVNTVVQWNGSLYIGTDKGIYTSNRSSSTKETDYLIQKFNKTRIRCLMPDSRKHLWVCTSDKGIFEISEDMEIKRYGSKAGITGDKSSSVIETKDGTIVAAADTDIHFIRNGEVYNTISPGAGTVLSLCEMEDGSIFAGTDGNGIVIIKDGGITGTLKQEDGLSSDVIHKIVADPGNGLFIVTGNGLCYIDGRGEIKILDNFPYYNNYDIVQGNNGELFVLSAAGIYITDKDQLLNGEEVKYELLDSRKGLKINLTPDSWNYIDRENNLYLSGNTGVVSINLGQYDTSTRSYRMLFTEAEADGITYPVEKGETTSIPRGAVRIEITPEIVNYSVNNPDISVYLEGFDKKPKVVPQNMLSSIVYTNLPSGEYTFHLAVLNNRTGSVIAENTYQIIKEKEIYDNWWFKLYVVTEAAIIISYLTWMFVRTQIQKTLRIQKMELEWAKNQLQMGNETIFTIAQAVDAKDEKTSKHSARVSEYSVMVAKKLGYSDEACEELRKIAMLHDIGKIGIPDQVLNKPSRLTDEEYEIMKSHVARGAEILKNFTLIDNVADGALYHHERYDGKGYINGLKGEEIPLNARIIGIADAFDAMTANRVYRKKLDIGHVLEELEKGRGTQFDPKLVDIMFGLIKDGTIDINQIYKPEDCEGE